MKNFKSIPVKRKSVPTYPDNNDENLNLSKAFGDNYNTLMNEEILKICRQSLLIKENHKIDDLLPVFFNLCDQFLQSINLILKKTKIKYQCRCEYYLDKFQKRSSIKKLFESSRFKNIQFFGILLMSHQPQSTLEVGNKLDKLKKIWNFEHSKLKIDWLTFIEEINEDILGLKSWLTEISKKMNNQTEKTRMNQNSEPIESILNDFKVHDNIYNSIVKTIEMVIKMDASKLYCNILLKYKETMKELIFLIHTKWLKVMELKYRSEMYSNFNFHMDPRRNHGQESGFESELSSATRTLSIVKLSKLNNISSSSLELDSDITDFPIDSESSELLEKVNIHNDEWKISNSLLTEPHLHGFAKNGNKNIKTEVAIGKKQKRLKKRKQSTFKSGDFNSNNICLEESENFCEISTDFCDYNKLGNYEMRTNHIMCKPDEKQKNIIDMATAAETIVVNDWNDRSYSISESEVESVCNKISSGTDLNLNEVWDNYQASLYSDEDDLMIFEFDKIYDWEQNIEEDDLEILNDYSYGNTQLITSGYETSFDCDPHLCIKNLINILKFSATNQSDVRHNIDTISEQLCKFNIFTVDKINSMISEQLSVSKIHLKLLDQININEPCMENQVEKIIEEIRTIQEEWKNLINKLKTAQSKCRIIITCNELDKIHNDIKNIDGRLTSLHIYNEYEDRKIDISSLKETELRLISIDTVLTEEQNSEDNNLLNNEELKTVKYRIEVMKKKICDILYFYEKDCPIFQDCQDRLKECQNTRALIGTKLKIFDFVKNPKEFHGIFDNELSLLTKNRLTLENCLEKLSTLTSENGMGDGKLNLKTEIKLMRELNIQLTLALCVNENLRSKIEPLIYCPSLHRKYCFPISRFFNRLSMGVVIIATIIAAFGMLYNFQSSNQCQAPTFWLKLFQKSSDCMKPF